MEYTSESMLATVSAASMFSIFISLALVAICVVITWKFFEKCGEEGWKSIIPIYNMVILYKIAGLPGWYVALQFIPCVGGIISLVLSIMCYINIAKSFNKSGAFAAGLILLNPIFLGILAFDSKEHYNGPVQ